MSIRRTLAMYCLLLSCMLAQSVPPAMRFSGTVDDSSQASRIVGITFSIYADSRSDAPLWQETQNVTVDASGHYSVLLGAKTQGGLPPELFSAGTARWLGIRVENGHEQRRTLLAAVPYAMKAQDAETLNGLTAEQVIARVAASFSSNPAMPGESPAQGRPQAPALSNATLPGGGVTPTTTPTVAGATNFQASTSDQVVNVDQQGSGLGIYALSPSWHAIKGETNGNFFGVQGLSHGASGVGVRGDSNGTSGIGIWGVASGTSGAGILGQATSPTGGTAGLRGVNNSNQGTGIFSWATSTSGSTFGIRAQVDSPTGLSLLLIGAGGPLFRAMSNNVQVMGIDGAGNMTTSGSVTAAGSVTAPSFSGDGSNLSNVDAATLNGLAASAYLSSAVTCNTGEVLRWSGSAWVCDGTLAKRAITFLVGCDNCGLLVDGDDQNVVYVNVIGTMTITNISCYSDAGAPSINLQRDDGSPADILTSPLSCGTSGASSASFSGSENVLNLNDKINFTMVTAGGLAHRATVVISATVN